MGHAQDMGGVKEAAQQGQRVPPAHGERPVQGHKADAADAQEGGGQVVSVRPAAEQQPA
ncbi:hypothetical protein SDC9_129635 [bioreactor metagenome]|uniref:Uncharacterized protein n=1 Tax=bioreactor metagenome TaxID=1076179 RepID=A0A645D035_9ZZZZ